MPKSIALTFCALSLVSLAALGQIQPTATTGSEAPATVAPSSTAFCLFELPEDNGKRRWLNLGIVQYVEFNRNELRIYYGGGNLGSGYEARLPIANPAQLQETLDRLRQTAANCR